MSRLTNLAPTTASDIKKMEEADRRATQFCSLLYQRREAEKFMASDEPTDGSNAHSASRFANTVKLSDSKNMAQDCATEAEVMELTARKLRQQADALNNYESLQKTLTALRSGAPINTALEELLKPIPTFACCGQSFTSYRELFDHQALRHEENLILGTTADSRTGRGDQRSQGTQTHAPPPSVRPQDLSIEPETTELQAPPAEMKDLSIGHDSRPNESDSEPQIIGFVEDTNQAEIIQCAGKATEWQPLAVRQMPVPIAVPEKNAKTFTSDFLVQTFGGFLWTPGLYYIPEIPAVEDFRAYWIVDGEWDPYLPSAPGEHGAKLSPIEDRMSDADAWPDLADLLNTPVFVRPPGKKEYKYYGNYSIFRMSDKLDYDRMMEHVPLKVREYWANQLTSPKRPEWLTRHLMEHFWPPPRYYGPIPADIRLQSERTLATEKPGRGESLEAEVELALKAYALSLKDWEREARVNMLGITASGDPESEERARQFMMDSFARAEGEDPPGLRLWWEYLQCVGYDEQLYESLVQLKYQPESQRHQLNVGGKERQTDGISVASRATPPIYPPTNDEQIKIWLDGSSASMANAAPPNPNLQTPSLSGAGTDVGSDTIRSEASVEGPTENVWTDDDGAGSDHGRVAEDWWNDDQAGWDGVQASRPSTTNDTSDWRAASQANSWHNGVTECEVEPSSQPGTANHPSFLDNMSGPSNHIRRTRTRTFASASRRRASPPLESAPEPESTEGISVSEPLKPSSRAHVHGIRPRERNQVANNETSGVTMPMRPVLPSGRLRMLASNASWSSEMARAGASNDQRQSEEKKMGGKPDMQAGSVSGVEETGPAGVSNYKRRPGRKIFVPPHRRK